MFIGTFVGIDVSKAQLDIALFNPLAEADTKTGRFTAFTAANDEAGIAALVERLTSLVPPPSLL